MAKYYSKTQSVIICNILVYHARSRRLDLLILGGRVDKIYFVYDMVVPEIVIQG